VEKKPGLPLNQDDVLKIIRKSRELGMTDSTIADALRISVTHLHGFVLRHGTLRETLREAMDVVKALRKVTPAP
jgi:hypothetical protein